METKKPVRRSQAWFGRNDRDGFVHRSWIKNQGYPHDLLDGRPVIGICNTWSELTPCNGHFRELAEFVKRGVYEAGGFPLEFPVMSLGETQLRPTAMLFRNLASMDVEESIRGNPIDGVVLLMGCDKTTPALMMGAASCDLPTIGLSGGPMLNGKFRGQDIGSGTGVWKMSEMVRAGEMTPADFTAAESCMHRSKGSCMTMGTASTMASMVEALGMALPENAAIPAADTRRNRLAQLTGRRIVEMVKEDLRMSKILTRRAFENAIRTNAAIGGSTNAVVHLLAIAGRLGIDLSLDDFDAVGAGVPLLVDLQPAGRHLMEDFHRAGGLLAVLREVRDLLDPAALTVTGRPLVDYLDSARIWDETVIRPRGDPLQADAGIAVLRGSLAPAGAVIKPAAASPELLRHRGRAVVFDSIEDFHARIDDPGLEVDAGSVLVLRGCGPKGYPGMPEVANLPLPAKLLERGVRDMVRVCDGRMSGTAYGTVVLHVAPEAAAGGPLGLVRTGDVIELDVAARRLDVDIAPGELRRREPPAAAVAGYAAPARGWERLYVDHVLQADRGADLDFLVGASGHQVTRDSH